MSRRVLFTLSLLAASLGATRALPAQRVAVAARALVRGTVLAATDIAWRDTTADAAARGAGVAEGWITRRVVAAGEPLRAPAVAPPPVVRANAPVRLVLRRDGVTLTLEGRAARDASLGERVEVRVDARRRFAGVVEGPGLVRMM